MLHAGFERVDIGDGAEIEMEAVEIVVVVLFQPVVAGGPRVEVAFRFGAEAQHDARVDGAMSRRDHLGGEISPTMLTTNCPVKRMLARVSRLDADARHIRSSGRSTGMMHE